ncbi:MAG: hypothetical protein AAFP81_00925 [Pseudomonadota bacterium]
MDDVLVSDIMGIFNRDDAKVVRIRRPDRTFMEGEISPDDVTEFSARLERARARDDSAEFDVSMVSNWVQAD